MKIIRRIKREARNSPAKALVLAALFGFAVYSWAPLVVGFLTVEDQTPRPTAKNEPQPGQPHQAEKAGEKPLAAAEKTETTRRPTWRQVRQWRQDSPWTAPAELSLLRDPFRLMPGQNNAVAASEESEEPPKTTPEQAVAGLAIQLTGTLVSPKRRVAIIDGRAYREGDTIRVEHLGTTWEMEIRHIEPNRVKLGWQSIEREVTLPERPQVGRIELVDRSRK